MKDPQPTLDRLNTLILYHAVQETEGASARRVRQQILLRLADITPDQIDPTLRYFVQECLGPSDLVGLRWQSASQVTCVARCIAACSSRPVWESYQPGTLLYELTRQALSQFVASKEQDGRELVLWLASLALPPPLLTRPGPHRPPRALLGLLLTLQFLLLFLGFPLLILEAETEHAPPGSWSAPHPGKTTYLDALTWTLLTPVAQAEEQRLPQSQLARRLTPLAGGTKLLLVSTLARVIYLHNHPFPLNPQLTHLQPSSSRPRYADDEDDAYPLLVASLLNQTTHPV